MTTNTPPANCLAHLAMDGKVTLLVRLMLAAIALLIFQVGMTFNLSTKLGDRIGLLEARVSVLEEKITEHIRRDK